MKRADITKVLDKVAHDIDAITDTSIRSTQKILLNLIEVLLKDNDELRAENQRLRDENNKLKGEQGKPNIRKQTKDISSEDERNKKNQLPRGERKNKKKRKKKGNLKISRTEICTMDRTLLPADVVFKGYQSVVVQEIIIQAANIKFNKETFYSPSENKTFMASLPQGYSGEFGPNLRKLVISLNHESGMTESCIANFLRNHEISIGAGTISRLLTQPLEMVEFQQEYQDITKAGLLSADYQQMDDTSARIKGKNYYTHILCNEFYTAYFTLPNKNRLTIIEILTQGEVKFMLNEQAFALMRQLGLPGKWLNLVIEHAGKHINLIELTAILNSIFLDVDKHKASRQIIIDATAIAAYQLLPYAVKCLLTDDAPQYNKIALYHALCWVHIGRHYKKLMPVVKAHQLELANFITKFWNYYHQLLAYKTYPTPTEATRLTEEFDALFSTKTGYDQLDERIACTRENKDQLLLVLEFPFLPLHNNASELGARSQARKRDISFHTMSIAGTKAKDVFMTLRHTAKKLAINFYDYIGDRINKTYAIPALADLIAERGQKMVLDST
jgi:hypothetical protein